MWTEDDPTGYEPVSEETTLHAHFAAEGLQIAAIEFLQIFPYQIFLSMIDQNNIRQTEFLAAVATIVSYSTSFTFRILVNVCLFIPSSKLP